METIKIKNIAGEEENACGPFYLSNGQKIAFIERTNCYCILVEKKEGYYVIVTKLEKGVTTEELVAYMAEDSIANIKFPQIISFRTFEEYRQANLNLLYEIASVVNKEADTDTTEVEAKETSTEINEEKEVSNEVTEIKNQTELANSEESTQQGACLRKIIKGVEPDRNTWKGSRYNPALTREEIVDLVNDYVYDKYKIDYRFDIYMMYRRGSSKIVIKLIEGPVPAFTNPDRTYIDTWKFYEENEKEIQKEILDVMNDVYDYAASFRYEKTIDEDDPCEFETNFTLNVKIGEKDRPYRC